MNLRDYKGKALFLDCKKTKILKLKAQKYICVS